MGFLAGKKAIIFGLASNRSIAHGIAQALHEQGAELAFTYQNDKLAERVKDMAAEFGSKLVYQCDVGSDTDIERVTKEITRDWGTLDILIHSVAFAPADQLDGEFIDCINREGFRIAHDISAYSLCALAKAFRPLLSGHDSAILALSYYGAEKAMPNYNVMGVAKASLEACVRYLAASMGPEGVRVNAISAGPIRTLAASGIKDLRKMMSANAAASPLRRNVTAEEVGKTAAMLCSDYASAVTGEIVHVDAGFHAVSPLALD